MVIKELSENIIIAGEQLLKNLDKSNLHILSAIWVFMEETKTYKFLLAEKNFSKVGPRLLYTKISILLRKNQNIINLENIGLIDYQNILLINLRNLINIENFKYNRIRIQDTIIKNIYITDVLIYRN